MELHEHVTAMKAKGEVDNRSFRCLMEGLLLLRLAPILLVGYQSLPTFLYTRETLCSPTQFFRFSRFVSSFSAYMNKICSHSIAFHIPISFLAPDGCVPLKSCKMSAAVILPFRKSERSAN